MGVPAEKNKRPDIHTYHDYLIFLKDWLEYLKMEQVGFSIRKLAADANVAVGYLSMCFNRKRRFSYKALQKLIPNLSLTRSEKRYLELLWTIAESEDSSVRLDALKGIQKFAGYKQQNTKEIEVYRYLTKWYYSAIRELAALPYFKEDPLWIQSQLVGKISLEEIRAALVFLLESGFLQRNQDGKLEIPQKLLDCKEGVYKLSLGEYHRQILQLAADSIDSTARSRRLLLGHTCAIARQDFQKIQDVLKECLRKVETVGTEVEGADEVYHVELAAFPLTNSETGEGELS